MKNQQIVNIGLTLMAIFSLSCRDENKIIYDTAKLPTGAYVRNLTLPPVAVTIASFSGTDFIFKAEIVGVASGSDVTSLDIKVRYIDPNGNAIKDYVALGSINAFAVEASTSNLPRGTVAFKGTDLLTKLSMTNSDLAAANFFEYALTLTLKDGRVYDASNFDPNMSNTFYLAGYDFSSELK
jgi:hypothetical protein